MASVRVWDPLLQEPVTIRLTFAGKTTGERVYAEVLPGIDTEDIDLVTLGKEKVPHQGPFILPPFAIFKVETATDMDSLAWYVSKALEKAGGAARAYTDGLPAFLHAHTLIVRAREDRRPLTDHEHRAVTDAIKKLRHLVPELRREKTWEALATEAETLLSDFSMWTGGENPARHAPEYFHNTAYLVQQSGPTCYIAAPLNVILGVPVFRHYCIRMLNAEVAKLARERGLHAARAFVSDLKQPRARTEPVRTTILRAVFAKLCGRHETVPCLTAVIERNMRKDDKLGQGGLPRAALVVLLKALGIRPQVDVQLFSNRLPPEQAGNLQACLISASSEDDSEHHVFTGLFETGSGGAARGRPIIHDPATNLVTVENWPRGAAPPLWFVHDTVFVCASPEFVVEFQAPPRLRPECLTGSEALGEIEDAAPGSPRPYRLHTYVHEHGDGADWDDEEEFPETEADLSSLMGGPVTFAKRLARP